MAVVAMMKCDSKSDSQAGDVRLSCVADVDGEYADFFEATPYGECQLGILNEKALEQFEPGAAYRVTFERVD